MGASPFRSHKVVAGRGFEGNLQNLDAERLQAFFETNPKAFERSTQWRVAVIRLAATEIDEVADRHEQASADASLSDQARIWLRPAAALERGQP